MTVNQINIKLKNPLLTKINNTIGQYDIETGGIIGIRNGIIDFFYFDKGLVESPFEYIPNINLLNNVISAWAQEGISFAGLIHSHSDTKKLSFADLQYAEQIIRVNHLHHFLMLIFLLSTREIITYQIEAE